MGEPICAQKGPYVLELKEGDYFWCACGGSKKQPFCDGSHKGTDFTPVKFSLWQDEKKALCGCKRSDRKPYCDGTHQHVKG
jgi:CDGSH iron-sulfur domain-containing protein 3